MAQMKFKGNKPQTSPSNLNPKLRWVAAKSGTACRGIGFGVAVGSALFSGCSPILLAQVSLSGTLSAPQNQWLVPLYNVIFKCHLVELQLCKGSQ